MCYSTRIFKKKWFSSTYEVLSTVLGIMAIKNRCRHHNVKLITLTGTHRKSKDMQAHMQLYLEQILILKHKLIERMNFVVLVMDTMWITDVAYLSFVEQLKQNHMLSRYVGTIWRDGCNFQALLEWEESCTPAQKGRQVESTFWMKTLKLVCWTDKVGGEEVCLLRSGGGIYYKQRICQNYPF